MNPYLEHEDAWHNFHVAFPSAVIAQLDPLVGPDFFLKIDEHVHLRELPDDGRLRFGRLDARAGQSASQPRLPAVDEERIPFLEIRDCRDRRVVTVIELLSPSDKKPGDGWHRYQSERTSLLNTSTHLVEIDLLRGGRRMPPVEPGAEDYCVLVSLAPRRPMMGWYPIRLRERLPVILVPLDPYHFPVPLDLQAVIHRLYDDGGYAKFLYETEPDPPLSPEDAAWAREILRAAGLVRG
jgi:hypothetical protein